MRTYVKKCVGERANCAYIMICVTQIPPLKYSRNSASFRARNFHLIFINITHRRFTNIRPCCLLEISSSKFAAWRKITHYFDCSCNPNVRLKPDLNHWMVRSYLDFYYCNIKTSDQILNSTTRNWQFMFLLFFPDSPPRDLKDTAKNNNSWKREANLKLRMNNL